MNIKFRRTAYLCLMGRNEHLTRGAAELTEGKLKRGSPVDFRYFSLKNF